MKNKRGQEITVEQALDDFELGRYGRERTAANFAQKSGEEEINDKEPES
jgi:hypothetical protein